MSYLNYHISLIYLSIHHHIIVEITKTSEYLPQRPANMMQADYSEQQESIANQSKKLAINATHRNLIKHSGYSGNYYAEHPSATNKVYGEYDEIAESMAKSAGPRVNTIHRVNKCFYPILYCRQQ